MASERKQVPDAPFEVPSLRSQDGCSYQEEPYNPEGGVQGAYMAAERAVAEAQWRDNMLVAHQQPPTPHYHRHPDMSYYQDMYSGSQSGPRGPSSPWCYPRYLHPYYAHPYWHQAYHSAMMGPYGMPRPPYPYPMPPGYGWPYPPMPPGMPGPPYPMPPEGEMPGMPPFAKPPGDFPPMPGAFPMPGQPASEKAKVSTPPPDLEPDGFALPNFPPWETMRPFDSSPSPLWHPNLRERATSADSASQTPGSEEKNTFPPKTLQKMLETAASAKVRPYQDIFAGDAAKKVKKGSTAKEESDLLQMFFEESPEVECPPDAAADTVQIQPEDFESSSIEKDKDPLLKPPLLSSSSECEEPVFEEFMGLLKELQSPSQSLDGEKSPRSSPLPAGPSAAAADSKTAPPPLQPGYPSNLGPAGEPIEATQSEVEALLQQVMAVPPAVKQETESDPQPSLVAPKRRVPDITMLDSRQRRNPTLVKILQGQLTADFIQLRRPSKAINMLDKDANRHAKDTFGGERVAADTNVRKNLITLPKAVRVKSEPFESDEATASLRLEFSELQRKLGELVATVKKQEEAIAAIIHNTAAFAPEEQENEVIETWIEKKAKTDTLLAEQKLTLQLTEETESRMLEIHKRINQLQDGMLLNRRSFSAVKVEARRREPEISPSSPEREKHTNACSDTDVLMSMEIPEPWTYVPKKRSREDFQDQKMWGDAPLRQGECLVKLMKTENMGLKLVPMTGTKTVLVTGVEPDAPDQVREYFKAGDRILGVNGMFGEHLKTVEVIIEAINQGLPVGTMLHIRYIPFGQTTDFGVGDASKGSFRRDNFESRHVMPMEHSALAMPSNKLARSPAPRPLHMDPFRPQGSTRQQLLHSPDGIPRTDIPKKHPHGTPVHAQPWSGPASQQGATARATFPRGPVGGGSWPQKKMNPARGLTHSIPTARPLNSLHHSSSGGFASKDSAFSSNMHPTTNSSFWPPPQQAPVVPTHNELGLPKYTDPERVTNLKKKQWEF